MQKRLSGTLLCKSVKSADDFIFVDRYSISGQVAACSDDFFRVEQRLFNLRKRALRIVLLDIDRNPMRIAHRHVRQFEPIAKHLALLEAAASDGDHAGGGIEQPNHQSLAIDTAQLWVNGHAFHAVGKFRANPLGEYFKINVGKLIVFTARAEQDEVSSFSGNHDNSLGLTNT